MFFPHGEIHCFWTTSAFAPVGSSFLPFLVGCPEWRGWSSSHSLAWCAVYGQSPFKYLPQANRSGNQSMWESWVRSSRHRALAYQAWVRTGCSPCSIGSLGMRNRVWVSGVWGFLTTAVHWGQQPFWLIWEAASKVYFNLNGDNIQESKKNWSQVHVYTVSVFEAFLPTPIVLTNAEVWDLQSTFHFGFGSTGLFCSLLLKPCLLKLKSCFPCSLPYLLNSSMGCLPTRAEGLYWEVAASCWYHLAPVLSPAPGLLGTYTADGDIRRSLCTGSCLWLWTGRSSYLSMEEPL